MYRVERVDSIITGDTSPVPAFYIVPDEKLLKYITGRTEPIAIRIENTSSPYDSLVTYSTLLPSAIVGGYRPNFQEETGMWAFLPQLRWMGYPQQSGQIVVLDFEQEKDTSVSDSIDELYDTISQPIKKINWAHYVALGLIFGGLVYLK